RLFGLLIDYRDGLGLNGTGDHELAIRRDVGIVDRALHGDAFGLGHGSCIDDVHRARRDGNRDVHPLSIFTDPDVVGMARERNALDHLQALLIHHVERALTLVAYVVTAAVRSGRRA